MKIDNMQGKYREPENREMNADGHKITEAIYRQVNDFRTDGSGAAQLSFPIMSLHIDFPAVDHPEVASDQDAFARLFLTDYCKALSRAFDSNYDDHNNMILKCLRARSGFSSTPSDFYQKNRALISDRNKYPVYTCTRACLLSTHLNRNYMCKGKAIFGNDK